MHAGFLDAAGVSAVPGRGGNRRELSIAVSRILFDYG